MSEFLQSSPQRVVNLHAGLLMASTHMFCILLRFLRLFLFFVGRLIYDVLGELVEVKVAFA